MTNRLALLLVAGLALTGTAWAQTSKDDPVIRELRVKATAGDAGAQYNLGWRYDSGRGVPQDDTQAVAWFRKAAEQGLAAAQNNLGTMYDVGKGVPQDGTLAYMWLNLAAARESGSKRDDMVKFRDEISSKLTPAQRADGQRMAREWQAAFEQRKK